jgi:hypothetical protein
MKLAIWTNSEDATVNYVCSKKPDWVEIIRFNSDEFFPLNVSKTYSTNLKNNNIDIIWHRRPFENAVIPDNMQEKILFSEKEEALWNLLLQIPKEKWINFPTNNWLADKKILQLVNANKCGLETPDWILTNNFQIAESFLNSHDWGCIIKPVNCGYFFHENNVYHIYTNDTDKNKIDLNSISNCPTYFQSKITKSYDVRTIYINGKTLFIGLYGGGLDVRRNEMKGITYKLVEPPSNVIIGYEKLMQLSNLRFCTSDFLVTTDDNWVFLENNANGQWVWMDEYLNGKIIDFFYNNIGVQHGIH